MKDHDLAPSERLVLVAWWDTNTATSWQDPPFAPRLATCLTAGWLISESDDAIEIGASAGPGGSFGDRTSIVRATVIWIRPLLVVPER